MRPPMSSRVDQKSLTFLTTLGTFATFPTLSGDAPNGGSDDLPCERQPLRSRRRFTCDENNRRAIQSALAETFAREPLDFRTDATTVMR